MAKQNYFAQFDAHDADPQQRLDGGTDAPTAIPLPSQSTPAGDGPKSNFFARLDSPAPSGDGAIPVDVTGGRLPHKGDPEYENFIQAGWKTDADGNLIDPHPKKPTSFIQGVGEGAIDVANHGAAWLNAGLNQLGGAGDAINKFGAEHFGMAPSLDAAKADQQRRFAERPVQGTELGRFAGQAAATAPVAALRGGMLLQGAVSGGLMSDAHDAKGVALDMGIGAAASAAGNAIVHGIANAAAPVVNPLVRRLLDAGIPLTPGQIVGPNGVVGRAVKRIEDSVSNLPLIGTAVRSARARGDDALNRAAINQRVLAPIGEALPANVETGHAAVAHAGDRLSAAYTAILPQLQGTIDRQFQTRLLTISQRAGMPPEYQPQVQQLMTEVSRAFTQNTGANGQFTGRTLRDATDRLDKLASTWRNNPSDPYLRRLGDTAQQLREQLFTLAARQNPAQAARLRAINAGWASLVRVEKAAAGTLDGVMTPKGYNAATRAADRTVRKRGSARGQALDQDLASAAARVMPSTVGEGGSNAVNGLAAMGGLGAAAFGGVPGAIGAIGAGTTGSLLYTRSGGLAAQWLLARQSGRVAQRTSRLLRTYAPVAGAVAGATAPRLVGPASNK